MKTVFLVRHGETNGNVERYAQGPDEPLNQSGQRQALYVAKRCASLQCTRLLASDMARATETAQIISEATNILVDLAPVLREVSCSEVYTGPSGRIEAELLLKEIPQQVENEEWFVEHGLESYQAVQLRARAALTHMQEISDERMIAVTHGTFMKFILGEIVLGATATMEQLHAFRTSFRFSNTGITQIDFNDQRSSWCITHVNDTAHFADV